MAGKGDAVAAHTKARVKSTDVPFRADQLEDRPHIEVGIRQGQLIGQGNLHVTVGVLDALDNLSMQVIRSGDQVLAEPLLDFELVANADRRLG